MSVRWRFSRARGQSARRRAWPRGDAGVGANEKGDENESETDAARALAVLPSSLPPPPGSLALSPAPVLSPFALRSSLAFLLLCSLDAHGRTSRSASKLPSPAHPGLRFGLQAPSASATEATARRTRARSLTVKVSPGRRHLDLKE